MSDFVVKHWIGQRVIVTLRSALASVTLKGTITQADEFFLVLEDATQARMLIPFTSVLHVEEDKENR
jgi:hypothetical protein